ncbi:hypothetical protein M422DRAFT_248799 [Sphaerobolus stellatus SS14]|nr:hypothetical protein M422DRAFT_248799 [Sphaerobolus stellatus SS14]
MVLYEADCTALTALFDSLPSTLPLNPPNPSLPPQTDIIFAQEERAWAAFNKAMLAAFGNKKNGLKIRERGSGLTRTVAVIQWTLTELHTACDNSSVPLRAEHGYHPWVFPW